MTDTSVSDAVVFPEDDGTGVADGSEDFTSAGYFGTLAGTVGSAYVGNGMGFTGNDSDGNGNWDELTVGAGHAFITQSGVSVQSGSQSSYDTTLPDDAVHTAVMPTSVTLTVTESISQYDVYVAFDPTSNDTVYIRHGDSGTISAPTDPSLYLGYADTTNNVAYERNRDPSFDSIANDDYSEAVNALGSISGTNTVDITNGNLVTTTLAGDTTFDFTGATASPQGNSFTMLITQDSSTQYSITWPSNVEWNGGTAPGDPSTGDQLEVGFISYDGGSTWKGRETGRGFA